MKAVCEETGLAHAKVSQYVKYEQLMPELKTMVDDGAGQTQYGATGTTSLSDEF